MSEHGRITHVAVRFRGTTYSLPAPNRHSDVIFEIARQAGVDQVTHIEQGFLDEHGRFLTRQEALVAALFHGQVKDPSRIRASRLFSEDVW